MPEKFKFLTRHLFLQVRDVLAVRIASGEWKVGSMVPNEAQLAQELGVSQGTVRKALDALEAEKIVIRRQGRGTFVVDHDAGDMAIRFSSITNALGQRIEGTILSETCELRRISVDEIPHLDATESDEVLCCRRLHVYHDRPFLLERSCIVLRHWPGVDRTNLRYDRITSLAQKHGVHLSHATETATPILCPPFAAEALQISCDVPVLHLHRSVWSDRGIKVEWREGWCHLEGQFYMSVMS